MLLIINLSPSLSLSPRLFPSLPFHIRNLIPLSFSLYNLARPDRNGVPINDLSTDEEAIPEYMSNVLYTSENEAKIDRVLTKAITTHSPLKPVISKRLRSIMKAKLYRMGKSLHNKNSRLRKIIIDRWREMQWCITLTLPEVRSSLVKEKENLQKELESEQKRNTKLAELRCRNDSSSALQDSQINNGRKRQARKSWDDYTPQYKRQKLKNVKEAAESVLRDKQLNVVDITVEDMRTGTTMNLGSGHQRNADYSSTDPDLLNLLLYAKERFGMSNAACHELSMLFPTLPHSNHLNERVKELNKQWKVFPTPRRNYWNSTILETSSHREDRVFSNH